MKARTSCCVSYLRVFLSSSSWGYCFCCCCKHLFSLNKNNQVLLSIKTRVSQTIRWWELTWLSSKHKCLEGFIKQQFLDIVAHAALKSGHFLHSIFDLVRFLFVQLLEGNMKRHLTVIQLILVSDCVFYLSDCELSLYFTCHKLVKCLQRMNVSAGVKHNICI